MAAWVACAAWKAWAALKHAVCQACVYWQETVVCIPPCTAPNIPVLCPATCSKDLHHLSNLWSTCLPGHSMQTMIIMPACLQTEIGEKGEALQNEWVVLYCHDACAFALAPPLAVAALERP